MGRDTRATASGRTQRPQTESAQMELLGGHAGRAHSELTPVRTHWGAIGTGASGGAAAPAPLQPAHWELSMLGDCTRFRAVPAVMCAALKKVPCFAAGPEEGTVGVSGTGRGLSTRRAGAPFPAGFTAQSSPDATARCKQVRLQVFGGNRAKVRMSVCVSPLWVRCDNRGGRAGNVLRGGSRISVRLQAGVYRTGSAKGLMR